MNHNESNTAVRGKVLKIGDGESVIILDVTAIVCSHD